MQMRAWRILITLPFILLVIVNHVSPFPLPPPPQIFFFNFMIHYSFYSEIYIQLFFVFQLFLKAFSLETGDKIDEHFQLNVLVLFIYFYCRLESSCWHAVQEYVPCSLVLSGKCWHSHSHICHGETVQLNRL